MKYLNASFLKQLTIDLCAIPSVSGNAKEENRCAEFILEELNKTICCTGTLFTAEIFKCEHDPLERKAVLALLRAPKATNRTVLLTGHFDVVDTEVFGDLAQKAFDLETYTEAIKSKDLAKNIRSDLDSNNWIFGRGSNDMKAGLALFIATIRELALDPELNINIAFLAVPDEEANSAGMRGSVRRWSEFIQEERLEVVAALTGEPCFWTSETKNSPAYRPYYTGTTGKIMPLFMTLGAEAHIGCYYEGFSAALLLAHLVTCIEGHPELIAGQGDNVLTPPACLSMQTRRSVYSVTLPERAVTYFNVLTIEKSPDEVLDWCRNMAAMATMNAVDQLSNSARAYRQKGGIAPDVKDVGIYTVQNIRSIAEAKLGSGQLQKKELEFYESQPKDLDARELSIRMLEHLVMSADVKGPAIIVGFVPPYYPARLNTQKNVNEKRLRLLMEDLTQQASQLAGDGAVRLVDVFGGITDLSFLGFDGDRNALDALVKNMPGWGKTYWLPIDELLSMDVPVANMAGAGRDAHKATERLELTYSFEIAPKLLLQAIRRLGE